MPGLSDTAAAEMRAALPSFGTANNPLDITGGAVLQPDLFEQGLRIMGKQPEFSALACLFDVPVAEEHATEFVLTALRHIAAGLHAADVPALMISHTVKPVTEVSTRIIEEIDLPYVSSGLHHGMNALGHAFWWSEQYRRLAGTSASIATIASASERPRSESATLDFLARCNVPVVPTMLVRDAAQAVAAAHAIGGRVALKIASDDIAHKSDIGGVALNLEGDAPIAEAFRRVMAAAPATARIDGVLLAPMRSGGLELFVGCTRDPQWGPVIAVGLGGVWVEVLQDIALRPLPIDGAEVKRMLAELRGAKLLHGVRGSPPADLDAVADVIARVGDAAMALGVDLEALEVNPLWVRGSEVEALDALAVWRNPSTPDQKLPS
jgi:acyl-CoA synthetase (NDP forming)